MESQPNNPLRTVPITLPGSGFSDFLSATRGWQAARFLRRGPRALVLMGVGAAGGERPAVRAALDHPPAIEHQHQVGVADGAQAMGHDETGPPGHQSRQGLLNAVLLEASTLLVAWSRIRIRGSASMARAKQMICRCPDGQTAAALAHLRLKTLRQGFDHVETIEHPHRGDQPASLACGRP